MQNFLVVAHAKRTLYDYMKINYSTNGVISIGELLGLINDDVAKDTIVGAGQTLVVLGETLKNSQQKIEDLKDRAH